MASQKGLRVALACTGAASLVFAFIGNHIGQQVTGLDLVGEADLGAQVGAFALGGLSHALSAPLELSGTGAALFLSLLGPIVPLAVLILALSRIEAAKRSGVEHGSAAWADPEEMRRFATENNPDPDNVLILSEHYGLALTRTDFSPEYDRNNNVCVIGGSGAGKTRYFVKPNAMQLFGNYVFTDPKGTLLPEIGNMLVDNGYEVAAFDTNIMSRSLVYNPLHYLRTDADILSFVKGFLRMTEDQRKSGGDPFWPDMTLFLLTCLITYLRDWCPRRNYSFEGVLMLLDYAEVRESDENYESNLDKLFREIETGMHRQASKPPEPDRKERDVAQNWEPVAEEVPSTLRNNTTHLEPGVERMHADGKRRRGLDPMEDYSLYLYRRFKQAAGKTMKSVLISVSAKLLAIMTPDVRKIMCGQDQMHLELLADAKRKYALFDIFQDTDPETFKLLHGLLIWQAIKIAVRKADEGTGFLDRHVHFFLDEFKTLNLPQEVADLVSTVRSRNVGMCFIVQSLEQLYQLYDDHAAHQMLGCCDTFLYLGGSDAETNKAISEQIGDETVADRTTSVSRSGMFQSSVSQNASLHARKLIDAAEAGKLGAQECLVCIKKSDPARDTRYNCAKHPRYDQVDPGHKPVPGPNGRPVPAKYTERFDLIAWRRERQKSEAADRPRNEAARARAEALRARRARRLQGTASAGGMPDEPMPEVGEARPRPKATLAKEREP